MKVITEAMPHVRSVSVGVWVGTGSRRETPEQNGVSHFIEHMLFKGTTTRSAEDIARSVDSLGGNLDAFTGKEMVCYNTKVLDEHLPIAMDILSDLVLNPAFREEDIGKEKGVILEEIKMDADNPDYLVHETFTSNFWKDHPLGRPILGTPQTVKNLTQEVISQYYREIYTPENLLVTAAGNLTHERLVALVSERFQTVRPGGPVPEVPKPATHARIALKTKKDLEQVHVCLGVPSYPIPHEDRFICYVLNTVLGGGMSSRLFQNIRERQGLAYAVFSELNPYTDTGCLAVYAGTSLESAKKVVDCVMKEFSELETTNCSSRRTPARERSSEGLADAESRIHVEPDVKSGAPADAFLGRFFTLDELVESIEKVTADQVQRVAQDFFRQEDVALTVLGNLNGFKLTRDDLVC